MDNIKNQRILYIFENLINNKQIKVNTLVEKFNVSSKTIHRDISSIKEYLIYTNNNVKYSTKYKCYKLEKQYGKTLDDEQIYSLLKIFLDSNTFSNFVL